MRIARFALVVLVMTAVSSEADAKVKRYALIVGNNAPPADEASLEPLKYADDDAARYFELTRSWGAESILLAVLDSDTQRRFPQLPIMARPPTRRNLDDAINALSNKAAYDRKRGDEPVLYFIFAGHGSVRDGSPYLSLLDARITQQVLYDEIIGRVSAARTHLIVDACHAGGVVGSRGLFDRELAAETTDVSVDGVAGLSKLSQHPNVGVILAATLGEEVHEWSRIESGVFSHEVISGLRGPADVNRDGRIEYSEIQAFVASANRDLKDRRTAPQVIAYPPAQDHHSPLAVLSEQGGVAWLEGNATDLGHFYVERESGERYLDAHFSSPIPIRFAIPANEALYVHTKTGEAQVNAGEGQILEISKLQFEDKALAERGSAEKDFRDSLFASPFSESYYLGFVDHGQVTPVSFDSPALLYDVPAPPNQKRIAIGFFSTSGAAFAATLVSGGIMIKAKRDYDRTEIQGEAAEARNRFESARTATIVSGSVTAVTAIVGAIVWPKKKVARFSAEVDPRRRRYGVRATIRF